MFDSVKSLLRSVREKGIDATRIASSPLRRRPDVIIIGAQKGGTTSLYEYLCAHPDVYAGKTKEVHYFDGNYDRGDLWYRSHFPLRRDGLSLEATPRYMFHRHALERIVDTVPEAKFIAVLREPVERAYSHYRHVRRGMGQFGHESRSFEEAVRADRQVLEEEGRILGNGSYTDIYYSYLRRGIYAPQLRRFREAFGKQLLAIPSFRLFGNTQQTLDRIFDFLNLPSCSVRDAEPHNKGDYQREIPLKHELRSFFQEYNRQLYDLLGTDPWWQYE